MKMKLAELISVATRKGRKPYERGGGLWRAWEIYSVFILEDVTLITLEH